MLRWIALVGVVGWIVVVHSGAMDRVVEWVRQEWWACPKRGADMLPGSRNEAMRALLAKGRTNQ